MVLTLVFDSGSYPQTRRSYYLFFTTCKGLPNVRRIEGGYLRRRALGQLVRIAAELRLGEGRLDKPPPGRMPALRIS